MDPRTKSHFYKSASDFKLEGSIDISETGDHHSASVLREKKDGSRWVRVENEGIDSKKLQISLKTSLLVSELYRFINIKCPQYAIYENKTIISRKVPHLNDFFDYYKLNILDKLQWTRVCWDYLGNCFLSGLGATILHLLFAEADFNFGNLLVTPDKYCVMIDHDWALSPITNSFHKKRATLSSCFFSVNEYDNFPILDKNTRRLTWQFHCMFIQNPKTGECKQEIEQYIYPYSLRLAQSKIFKNEKHFYSFKTLVTLFYQKILISALQEKDDLKAVEQLWKKLLCHTLKILKKSNQFLKWLHPNHEGAINAILFELNKYIKSSPSLIPNSNEEKTWTDIVETFIEIELFNVLKEFDIKYTESHQEKIFFFANQIRSGSVESLHKVADFYEKQKMTVFANLAYSEFKTPFCHQPVVFLPVSSSTSGVSSSTSVERSPPKMKRCVYGVEEEISLDSKKDTAVPVVPRCLSRSMSDIFLSPSLKRTSSCNNTVHRPTFALPHKR
jgi:hypothetical protein